MVEITTKPLMHEIKIEVIVMATTLRIRSPLAQGFLHLATRCLLASTIASEPRDENIQEGERHMVVSESRKK